MKNTIFRRVGALVLALALVMGTVIVPSYAAGDEKQTSDLVDFNLILTQDGNVIPEGGEIRYEEPFSVQLSFIVPQVGGNLAFETGDFVKFYMPNIIFADSPPIKLKGTDNVTEEEIDVATAIFDGDYLKITFDNNDVFGPESDYVEVGCLFNADFKYGGAAIEDGDEVSQVLILGKEFTFVPTRPEFTISKSGVQKGSEIEWEVKIKAEKDLTPPVDGSLAGIVFKDELDGVGNYVAGSFEVTGDITSGIFNYDASENSISYVFPDGATGEHTIKFKTEVPAGTLINGGSVDNTGKIYNGDPLTTDPVNMDTDTVLITAPDWINKEGSVNKTQNGASYDPTGREITWTITINEAAATLNNVTITDTIPGGLVWKSASWKEWDAAAGDWKTDNNVATQPSGGVYSIGNITDKVELTIVTTVPDEAFVLSSKTFTNYATVKSGEIAEQTDNENIGIGYSGFTKAGSSDVKNGTVEWTLDLDPKGQSLTDIVIYDLFVYGNADLALGSLTNDASPSYGDTGGPAFPTVSLTTLNLTQNKNMKFDGSYSKTGGHADTKYSVYTLKDSDGNAVADLLIIDVEDNSKHSFKFKTKITDPKIYAANTGSNYTIPNTANLHFKVGGVDKAFDANGNASYVSNTITKGSLSRTWTSPANNGTSNNSFDYEDKSVVYKLLVNKNNMNLTGAIGDGGQGLSNISLKDTLPLGWEFKDIDSSNEFLLYKADGSGNHVGEAIDPTSIVSIAVTPATETDAEFATFNFTELTGAYIILLRAGPTDETAKEFFEGNKVVTGFQNVAEFFLDGSKLAEGKHTVNLSSTVVKKSLDDTKANSDGYLIWTVDYNPYNIEQDGFDIEELAIVDTPELGLDFRTDSEGNLLIEGNNVKAYKMKLKSDGSIEIASEITLVLGENIFYDTASRELKFIIEDTDAPHRLVYITDITGVPGETLRNNAMLTLKGSKHEGTEGSYEVSDSAASATLKRGGNMTITKIEGEGTTPLAGVEFKLISMAGLTIREGKTDANGKLTFKAIPEGEYKLVETVPSGYRDDDKEYPVTVGKVGSEVITSIDGQTGEVSNKITLRNYKENTVGDLSISKTLSGNAVDSSKEFNFTLKMESQANKTYSYIGGGSISDGTFTFDSSGEFTFKLKGDDSIRIIYLPKGASYEVTEDDANKDGYTTSSTLESGTIDADGITNVNFENKKGRSSSEKTGSINLSKLVTGDGGDKDKKFNFTVTFSKANENFVYSGPGIPTGFIKSGGTISLSHGQSVTIVGIPEGTEYAITEEDYSSEGYKTTSVNRSGTISGDTIVSVKFTNDKESEDEKTFGSLKISKIVTGSEGEKDRKFKFTVSFSDKTASYPYTGVGLADGIIKSGDSFELANGQSIIIKDIPTGTQFTVSENDYRDEGYKQSASGYKGTIEKGVQAGAEFTNAKGSEVDEPDVDDDGFILGEDDSNDTDKPGPDEDGGILGEDDSNVPKTGDGFMPIFWLASMLLSLLGIFFLLRRRSVTIN